MRSGLSTAASEEEQERTVGRRHTNPSRALKVVSNSSSLARSSAEQCVHTTTTREKSRKKERERGRKEGRKERKREVRRKERFVVAPQSAQIGSGGGGGDGGDDCGGGGGRQDVRIITNGEKRVRVTEQLRTAACE